MASPSALRPLRKVGLWFTVRLTSSLTVLFWAITLLPFYRWVMFQQTGRRRVSASWATHFLLTHGWRDLLKIGAAELAWSICMSLLLVLVWNRLIIRTNREVALATPDLNPGVWPPPPTASASADFLPKK